MKKLLLPILLLFVFSSSAYARDCLYGYEKIELTNEGDITGQYECVKLYPAKQNTICPPLFTLKDTGNFSYKCNIVGVKAKYMCKNAAGKKIAGSELVFSFNALPLNRFPAISKAKYRAESRQHGGNRNPNRVIAYQCN